MTLPTTRPRQARLWRELAASWCEPPLVVTREIWGFYARRVPHGFPVDVSCLCQCIDHWCQEGRIKPRTRMWTLRRLRMLAPQDGSERLDCYWWNEGKVGADARMWTCLFLAEMGD